MQINLPTDLLRTFVTVIEVKSYTHAAALLGRTQPAISLQMQRLEELVGQPLLSRSGREVSLTARGESLIAHARQILRLNDIAVSQFNRVTEATVLRVGLPVDYGVHMLQSCLTEIIQQNPDLKTEVRCDLSCNLIDGLRNDALDIALGLYPGGDQQFLFRNWLEKPVWVGGQDNTFNSLEEIPLVVHPAGCVYRDRMTDALRHAKRRWRVAFSSPGIASIQQAVLDGLGVSCLTAPTMIDGLQPLQEAAGLPDLEPLHIGLFYRQTRLTQQGHQVVDAIAKTLDHSLGT